jgi:HSP20 family molecular chaperone IbpA
LEVPDKAAIQENKRAAGEFREEIPLPPEVDIERCVEHFRNGILEIVLPRKKSRCSN